MSKQQLLKPVNSVMALVFLCLACTALLDDVIPREIYEVVHPLLGYTFLACVASHVFLNWSWVKNAMFKKAKPKA